jgi:CheY-like chemotaxis protein
MAPVVHNQVRMGNQAKRVLIVEDNAEWRELLTMIIKRAGHEPVSARTGKEGLEQASATQPDLILMDLGLPEIGGDEATEQLKSNPATKDIPVVIQTAFGAGSAAKRALNAGAAELMQKPISITDIQKVLVKYLSLSKPASRGLPTARF